MITTHIFKFAALFTIVLGVSLGTHAHAVTTELATTKIAESTGYNNSDADTRVAMEVNEDGNPILAYVDIYGHFIVAACNDTNCTDPTFTTVFATNSIFPIVGNFDLAIGSDNKPIIVASITDELVSTSMGHGELWAVNCTTETCSESTSHEIVVPDAYDNFYDYGSVDVVVGADNLPVILPPDLTRIQNGEDVYHRALIKCTTSDCSENKVALYFSAPSGGTKTIVSLTLGSNGFPAFAYTYENSTTVTISLCANAECTTTTGGASLSDQPIIGDHLVLTKGADNRLVLTVENNTGSSINELSLIRCQKKDCSKTQATYSIALDPQQPLQLYDIAVNKSNQPVIAVRAYDDKDLMLIECTDSLCNNYSTQKVVDVVDELYDDAQVRFGKNGALMVGYNTNTRAYFATTKRVKTVDYTFSINEIGSTLKATDVHPFDMVIGKDGKPIIAYYRYAGDDQKTMQVAVAICSDASCTDGEAYIVDPTMRGTNTSYTGSISIALDKDGYPVIVYGAQGKNSDDLFVAKCNDRKCCDATITTLLSEGKFRRTNDVIVPADGKPVITYYAPGGTSGGLLKLIKCASSDCSTFNESYTINNEFIFEEISMVIGSNGHPAVIYPSHQKYINVYTCGDDDCAKDDAKNTVAYTADIDYAEAITEVSAVKGKDGNFFIAYGDIAGTDVYIKMLKCLNADCTSSSDIVIAEGPSKNLPPGLYPSIAVTADNRPLISYAKFDDTNGQFDMALAQCVNAQCSSNTITIFDTANSSISTIMLGKDKMPVISYQNNSTGLLYLAKAKR